MTTRTLTGLSEGKYNITALVVPLTTIFTPPPPCPSTLVQGFAVSSTTCAPPEFSSVWYNAGGFYSPGICPNYYTIGCTVTGEWYSAAYQFPDGAPSAGESAYICVPSLAHKPHKTSGYTCVTFDLLFAQPTGVPWISGSLAAALQIRWQSSDLSILPANPLSPQTRTTEAASKNTESTSATGTFNTNTGPTAYPTANKTGPIVGISASAVVFFIIVLLVLRCLWRRFRRGKKKQTTLVSDREAAQLDGQPILELDATASSKLRVTQNQVVQGEVEIPEMDSEAPARAVSELPSDLPVPELGTLSQVVNTAETGTHPSVAQGSLRMEPQKQSDSIAAAATSHGNNEDKGSVPTTSALSLDPKAELQDLLKRQSQLIASREVLSELARVQQEEERVRERIEALQRRGIFPDR